MDGGRRKRQKRLKSEVFLKIIFLTLCLDDSQQSRTVTFQRDCKELPKASMLPPDLSC